MNRTDRDRWGLRGPVQSCRLQRTWYSRDCGPDACENVERGDIDIVEFRPDGSLTRNWHRNPDSSEWTTIYEYDNARRRVNARTESTGGTIELLRYEYDSAGRLLRLIARDKDGTAHIAESWAHDAIGRKTRTLYVDAAGQRANKDCGWAIEGTDAFYSAPGAVSVTTSYNEQEQPVEVLFRDTAGRLLSRVELIYDADGHLMEEAQTRTEEGLPAHLVAQVSPAQMGMVRALFGVGEPTRRFHRYDLQGRRCETHSETPPLGADRKTIVYNNHGDPIEEHFECESREYGMDDAGRLSDLPINETVSRSDAHIDYGYDPHGNWVQKTVKSGRQGKISPFRV